MEYLLTVFGSAASALILLMFSIDII
jgi:hypothetical protein